MTCFLKVFESITKTIGKKKSVARQVFQKTARRLSRIPLSDRCHILQRTVNIVERVIIFCRIKVTE